MKGVVDKIKGSVAFVEFEGREMTSIPLSSLPPEVKVGYVITRENNIYSIDYEETKWLNDAVQRCYLRSTAGNSCGKFGQVTGANSTLRTQHKLLRRFKLNPAG